jgi:hypothetical protein
MPPERLDVPVWRYLDFTKFVSMLENGGLFFPTVAKLHDPFEGSFAKGNEVLRDKVYRHVTNRYKVTAGEWVQMACSPKIGPSAMRVCGAKAPPNSQHETQTTHTRRDHQEAA